MTGTTAFAEGDIVNLMRTFGRNFRKQCICRRFIGKESLVCEKGCGTAYERLADDQFKIVHLGVVKDKVA